MKTKIKLATALITLFCTVMAPSITKASEVKPATPTESSARVQELTRRLEEIKSMDTQNMSRSEKKKLRKEVKNIKKEMDSYGGIYISAGALLVIIILLIILL